MTTPTDPLSSEKLQQFVTGLANLSREEIRKAKSLYIRNAISELKALDENMRAFGCVQIFFALIPIFWPILCSKAVVGCESPACRRTHSQCDRRVERGSRRGNFRVLKIMPFCLIV